MNCSLLDDDDYVEAISKMIPVWVEEGRGGSWRAVGSSVCLGLAEIQYKNFFDTTF